jgi:hypothetical protein
MAEFSETEFSMKRKDVLALHTKIAKFLVQDFDDKFKTHSTQGHKWFIQGTIHGICKSLTLDKQLVIYLVLGSNPRRTAWGNLKEKYNIEPIKYILRREVVSLGKTQNKELFFKVFFTDLKGNGDFQMKVVYYKKGEEEPKKEAFVPKLKSKPANIVLEQGSDDEEIIHEIKPTIIRKYADAALRGKDKPAPKPLEDPKKKKVMKANITMLAESSSDEEIVEEHESTHSSVSSKD